MTKIRTTPKTLTFAERYGVSRKPTTPTPMIDIATQLLELAAILEKLAQAPEPEGVDRAGRFWAIITQAQRLSGLTNSLLKHSEALLGETSLLMQVLGYPDPKEFDGPNYTAGEETEDWDGTFDNTETGLPNLAVGEPNYAMSDFLFDSHRERSL